MSFKKGQSGNPSTQFSKENQPENPGRPPILPDLDLLLARVLGKEKKGRTAAEEILAALQAKAAKGDIRAAEVLMNRGYGFPKQSIDHTTKGDKITDKIDYSKLSVQTLLELRKAVKIEGDES